MFVITGPFIKGSIDHVRSDVFNAFPRLLRVHDAVKAHPAVVAWYASH